KAAQRPDAKIAHGDHCRWCAAKPICPVMNGALDRQVQQSLVNITPDQIGACLERADALETYIKDVRDLAFQILDKGGKVPGYKLVAKRATRKWVDDAAAEKALFEMGVEPHVTEIISPAAAEKLLKKSKLALPDDLVKSVSSGNTMVPESDPRPAVLQIGQQLSAAFSKLGVQ
ncbi:MAG: hypothetical protein RL441_1486, partial [Actinomycetota bacterium]